MSQKLKKKEAKVLKQERAALVAQSEAFLEDDDYEILPDIFMQIADISQKLGEQDLVDDFTKRAEAIRALLEAPALPPKQEAPITPPSPVIPPPAPAPSFPPISQGKPTPPKPPTVEPPFAPPSPKPPTVESPFALPSPKPPTVESSFASPSGVYPKAAEPAPAIIPPPAPKVEKPPMEQAEDSMTEKLQRLKSLADIINIPRLAPEPTLPPERPIAPPTTTAVEPSPTPSLPSAPPPESPDSLIEQRRKEVGEALDSGIVPTIVKDERDVIQEILNEKLPFMPDREKSKAIDKILTYPAGVRRDAWLKVFLFKNKNYAPKET